MPHKTDLFVQRLNEIVLRHANRAAVVVGGKTALSYRQLWNTSGVIARQINQFGLGRESVVGVCVPKSAEYIATIVGIWRAGAAWVPLEPSLPKERIRFLTTDSDCELVVCDPTNDFGGCETLDVAGLLDSKNQPSLPTVFAGIDSERLDLAYIIYTSGSTGKPKGVEVTHRGIVAFLDQQISALHLTPNSRSLFLLSTSFDASVSDIGTALLSGASLLIEPELHTNGRLVATADAIVKIIADREITYIDIPPSLLSKIDPKTCPPCLTTILIGGEVCSASIVRQWASKVRLINVYGPTEATVCSSLSICDPTSWDRPLIGQPLDGIEYLIDGEGGEGELMIAGDCLARGYRNRSALTAQRFVKHGCKSVYRTGDIVRLEEDGEYRFLGRIDRQIKLRGHRIEPGEIEAAIELHVAVHRAAVIFQKDSQDLIAVIESNSQGNQFSKIQLIGEVRIQVAKTLPSYAMPHQFFLVEELPVTASNKVDYNAISKLVLERQEDGTTVSSELENSLSSDEKRLADIFETVLGHRNFTKNDHFFSVGGDSLGVIEACAIAQSNGIAITPQILVAKGSIRELCLKPKSVDESNDPEFLTSDWLRTDVTEILAASSKTPSQVPTAPKGRHTERIRILLTGATGFLGSRILASLLKNEDTFVTCLVRATDDAHARRRLDQTLANNRLDITPTEGSRFEALAGDIEVYRFGWPIHLFDQISSRTDKVIHCAANVNTVASYQTLRKSNLIGVNHVGDFAANTRLKQLEYISTLSVFVGTDQFQGQMFESDDLLQTERVYGGYAQTKWAAEVLLQRRNDITTRYFRLGLLTADTVSGVVPEMDLLTLTIRGLVEIGLVPDSKRKLRVDITPVNYAAEMVTSITSLPIDKKVFHVAHPIGLTAKALFDNLRIAVPTLKLASLREFETRAKKTKMDWRTCAACLALCRTVRCEKSDRPDPMDLFQATGTRFDMTNVQQAWKHGMSSPPELSNEFVQQLIRQILDSEEQLTTKIMVSNHEK
ncbi:MAG: amino acid adenylation domain-containing protein [Mariniblastus sp.]